MALINWTTAFAGLTVVVVIVVAVAGFFIFRNEIVDPGDWGPHITPPVNNTTNPPVNDTTPPPILNESSYTGIITQVIFPYGSADLTRVTFSDGHIIDFGPMFTSEVYGIMRNYIGLNVEVIYNVTVDGIKFGGVRQL